MSSDKHETTYTWAYLADGSAISIPEVRWDELPEGHTILPIRGSGYTAAVIDPQGVCVGWKLVIPPRGKVKS